jgi:aspartate carbamoyltransferase catalytic subunit
MHDLLSITDLDKKGILSILSEAGKMERALSRGKPPSPLKGKIVANLFFEPSTRTNLSFQAAALRLGANALAFSSAGSSAAKGESFEDTVRMVDGYADCLVVRHPDAGSARAAAGIASHPVINAGDGGNQHPTQALTDLYTIMKLKGKIEGQSVTLMGDLKYARAMRSLLWGLSLFGADTTLVSPPQLRMDPGIVSEARKLGASIAEHEKPDLSACDVLYVCRIQKERFADPSEAKRMQGLFRVEPSVLCGAKKSMAILHPLPKVDEMPPAIDSDPRAKYFEQAKNGVPVRMAVLKRCILGK